jgi:hypothetical protein
MHVLETWACETRPEPVDPLLYSSVVERVVESTATQIIARDSDPMVVNRPASVAGRGWRG